MGSLAPRLRLTYAAVCAEPSNLPSHGSLPGVNTSAAAPAHALTPSSALLPKLARAQHLRQPPDAQAAGTCSRAAQPSDDRHTPGFPMAF